jgi:phosphate transport system substrate-binding protein
MFPLETFWGMAILMFFKVLAQTSVFHILTVAWAVLALSGDAAADTSGDRLVLSGSSTIAPLISEISKRYERLNPKVRVDVQTGGSSRGIADARRGLAQIGMASRSLTAKEGDLVSYTIAWDGIACVVHKANPVTDVTKDQFRKILSGEITDWQKLGGTPGPVIVVGRAEGRSELEIVVDYLKIDYRDIKSHMIVGENAHVVKTIAGNRSAISYMSIGHALTEASLGTAIKVLALNGVAPTSANVSAQKFPLSRPLNLVTRKDQIGKLAFDFVNFAQSGQVHGIIKGQSFIPIFNR